MLSRHTSAAPAAASTSSFSCRPRLKQARAPRGCRRNAFPQGIAGFRQPPAASFSSPVSPGSPRLPFPLLQRRAGGTGRKSPNLVTRVTSDTPPPEITDTPQLPAESRIADLGRGITQVSLLYKERFAYEVEYSLARGTSENCYIARGPAATALLGLPDDQLSDAFVEALPIPPRYFTHIVVPHFGPKRAAALVHILEQRQAGSPPVQIICGNAALGLLRESLPSALIEGEDFNASAVRAGSVLKLGDGPGERLCFTLTPTPRWPDLFASYYTGADTLFTAKLFSCHVCTEEVYDEAGGWESFREDWSHFFQCNLASAAKQSKQALMKLQGYQMGGVETRVRGARSVVQIAPMHGVVIRSNVAELVREYRAWTERQILAAEAATVAVIYASAYGNTTALAQAISRGISKAGAGVESLNCELASLEDVKELMKRCDGFVLGSPTLGGHMPTPVQEALGAIIADSESSRRKPCGVFGSFGWSGEAIDMMQSALKDSGFTFSFDPIRCKFKPTMEMLQICEESGTDLAQQVLKGKRKQNLGAAEPRAALGNSSAERAMGRIVGSLCVVTTSVEDASSAMLASWVSQASFAPPGITVAVAKERAVEGLLTKGSDFVLSVLAEGRSGQIVKQMLKPFKPGEDRFAGYKTQKADGNGLVVVPEAASYVECVVETKMDVGDHWVVYAIVKSGKVLDDTALTAIHHRKAGTTY